MMPASPVASIARLERELDGFRSRSRQRNVARLSAGASARELLEQRDLHVGRMDVAHPCEQPPGLLGDRAHDRGIRVAALATPKAEVRSM